MGKIHQNVRSLADLARLELLDEIRREKYLVGSRLPNEGKLAEEMGVSRNTLREALRVMAAQGIVEKRQGLGTFVRAESMPNAKPGLEVLFRVTDAITALGMSPGTSEIELETGPINPMEAERLRIQSPTVINRVRRVRTADEVPVVYCLDVFSPTVGTLVESELRASIFVYLEEKKNIHISYASTDIRPTIAGQELAGKLGVSAASPLLLLDQIHFDDRNLPILYSRLFFRPDYFVFHVVRKR
ncbi:HTH-type transcriptional repressor YvoA [Peptococcaceae bacterium CEB3]|nr:HTH-type transcriptional repressor YvoA [Peptococcaceae bacterium CEB3]